MHNIVFARSVMGQAIFAKVDAIGVANSNSAESLK
jgi:hypothetical protein